MVLDPLSPALQALAPDRSDHPLAKLPHTARLFCVGGAVRDALLGESSSDRDYLVVGCRPEHMLAAGFVPVGKDFPVFLHPSHHAEYALARTERKTGRGYQGFVFQADESVTLEDDLARRDLTINALAVDEQGQLHDPYGGLRDLRDRTLRHVSPAFEEDPVRLIRLARFLSRWPDFKVASETRQLCEAMVSKGEVDSLVPERVWQELLKGLQAQRPSAMLAFLSDTGAWSRIVGEPNPASEQWGALDAMAQARMDGHVLAGLLFASSAGGLAKALPKSVQQWQAFFASQGLQTLADLSHQYEAARLARAPTGLDPLIEDLAERAVQWLARYDLFRKPEPLDQMVNLVIILGLAEQTCVHLLAKRLALVAKTPMGVAAQTAATAGQDIKTAVSQARAQFLAQALRQSSP
jgi:tRNA nucleotidyltransferase (CCA-adding enzyme)